MYCVVTDFVSLKHSSYGVKARHGDGGAPGRLGARLARLGAHSARRWGGRLDA